MADRPDGIFIGPRGMAKRLALWSFVAWVSAGPSFVLALGDYDGRGMLLGIAVWIALLTLVSSTVVFERFARVRGVRRTFRLGYGLRVAASVIYPVGWFVDVYAGVFSVWLGGLVGFTGDGFGSSFAITVIQGGTLNALVLALMLLVYPIVRRFTKPAWDGVERCRSCGYDLRGRSSGRCPECGDATVATVATVEAAPQSSSTAAPDTRLE